MYKFFKNLGISVTNFVCHICGIVLPKNESVLVESDTKASRSRRMIMLPESAVHPLIGRSVVRGQLKGGNHRLIVGHLDFKILGQIKPDGRARIRYFGMNSPIVECQLELAA